MSQQGEPEAPDLGLGLDAPPPCDPKDPPSHYMNILYNAVQRQGGRGSVETALSPYLAMTRDGRTIRGFQLTNVHFV